MKRLTLEQIVKKLKRERPMTVEDLLHDCKFPLQLLNYGQFRRVYKLLGTPYVIKVPKAVGNEDTMHSRNEISALKLLRKDRYSAIHPYLPTFHFSNRNTGIILTDECKWASYAKNYDLVRDIHDWSEDNGFAEADVDHRKMDNYGMLGTQLKILDLGCFVNGGSNC